MDEESNALATRAKRARIACEPSHDPAELVRTALTAQWDALHDLSFQLRVYTKHGSF